ncbi:MAG: mannose-6-phosphate isomerase [Marinilabiliales bacterium]|nr:MAG: mannose-6-phosphate isomerase [Marinilabiliales bacterium]
MLYPLKFNPIFKEKIWGGNKLQSILNKKTGNYSNVGESWELSGIQNEISVVSNGFLKGNNLQEIIEVYMGDLVGESVYKKFGVEFPLLIKLIDANDDLSIQVHPDDKTAKERHKAYGKTEMWYILEADEDALIYTGFNKKTDKKEYLEYLHNGNVAQLMNKKRAFPGDVFYIPSGRVHAIGKGVFLAEIQQTSDITYRIFDWNRKDSNGKGRELHTDLAIDVIDYNFYDTYKTHPEIEENTPNLLSECQYFTTQIIKLSESIERDYFSIDSFVIYMCTKGSFTIEVNDESYPVYKGETILIPAELKNINLVPENEAELLEIYIKTDDEKV